jgi:hypothetical protein
MLRGENERDWRSCRQTQGPSALMHEASRAQNVYSLKAGSKAHKYPPPSLPLSIVNFAMPATAPPSPASDEETPLLSSEPPPQKTTPVPWAQVWILIVLLLAEPLTSQVIFPFTPEVCHICILVSSFHIHPLQFVRNVGITHGDESRVGLYVGMMVCLGVDLSTHLSKHCLALYVLCGTDHYSLALG